MELLKEYSLEELEKEVLRRKRKMGNNKIEEVNNVVGWLAVGLFALCAIVAFMYFTGRM